MGALVLALTFVGVAAAACGGSDARQPSKMLANSAPTSQASASTPTASRRGRRRRSARPNADQPADPAFAKQYVRTEWNYLASSALPKDLYDMFLPECQKMVTVESLAKSPRARAGRIPGLKGTFIQDITFQDTLGVKFVDRNQLQIVVPKFSQSTVTINGKQQNMLEWVKSISATTVQGRGAVLPYRADRQHAEGGQLRDAQAVGKE